MLLLYRTVPLKLYSASSTSALRRVSPVLHGIEHGLAEDRVGNVRHQLLDVRDLHGIFGGFRRHARSDGQAKRKAQRGAINSVRTFMA